MKTYYALEAYPIVLEKGIDYHSKLISDENNPDLEKLYELIYLSAMALEKYDIAYGYIGHRRRVLPVTKQYLASLDLIAFKKQTNQSYTEDIQKLLTDDLPDKIRLSLLKELLVVYLKQGQANKAITLIDDLKRLDYEQSYIPLYLKTLISLKNFDAAKKVATQYREDKRYAMDAFMALLKIYIHENDRHKLAILDGDFNERLDDQPLEFKEEAYRLFAQYYKTIKIQYLHESYEKKHKAVLRELKKVKKTQEVMRDDDASGIQVTDHQVIIDTPSVRPKQNIYHLDAVVELTGYAHQIDYNKNYREFLRLFFIRASEFVEVSDFIVFTKQDDMLYHYKKERLYDKELVKETYEQTIRSEKRREGKKCK